MTKKPGQKKVAKKAKTSCTDSDPVDPMNVDQKCGAKNKQSVGTCRNTAGFRTGHLYSGRCYLHGGRSRITHGMTSTVTRARLADRIKHHLENPDPLNLLPEVAQLRAFAEDLMERWDLIYGPDGALLAWHESFMGDRETPKPRQLPDFSAVSTVVDRVGAMVDRIQKHKAEGTISLATLNRALEQLGAEVVSAVKEIKLTQDTATKLLNVIERRWGNIRLEPDGGGGNRNAKSEGS